MHTKARTVLALTLMLALPLCAQDTELEPTPPIESEAATLGNREKGLDYLPPVEPKTAAAFPEAPEPAFEVNTPFVPETPPDALADLLDQEAEDPGTLGRTTIVPWSVDVLGKNYESFPNNEASRVLSDWLVNSLMNLNVFNIVNRDKMHSVLSEQHLAASGYTQEVSPSALASAGKLLKVNFILFGNFKNLGKTSEVDFKLLDVDTTTYSHAVNFSIPFNAEIEKMKPEIDRIVAALAAHFPVVAPIREILADRRMIVGAGTEDGIADAMEVELWHVAGRGPEKTGFIIRADATEAEVELDGAAAELNLFDYVAHIKIVPPAQAALKKGLRDLETGRYQEAAAIFQKGLEADPDDGLLHANYARSCWRSGDYKRAVDAFRKAVSLRPDDVSLLEDTAAAMLESGHMEELIEILEKNQRRNYSQNLQLDYGESQEILGYLERARDAYRAALKQDPNHPETHFRLAVLAAKRRDLEEAEREFRLAQPGAGESLQLHLGIEAFAAAQNGSAEARAGLGALLDRAQMDRDFAALATASEVLLIDQRSWQLSLKLAKQSLEINPNFLRATIAAAQAHAAGRQRAQAIALLNEALRAYPSSFALLFLSGQLLTAEQSFAEAESRFRQAQDLAREDWRPSDALGDIYTLQQDDLKAVRGYLDALERAEAAAVADLTPHLYKLGTAAVRANQHETARPYLERCTAGAPDHKECQYHLALCYLRHESPASDVKALASFEAAGAIHDTYYHVGTLYERQEAVDDALAWHRRCVAGPCEAASRSQKRIDVLESVMGKVSLVRESAKQVTLDIGRIHGVTHSLEGVVVQGSHVVSRVQVEQVQDKTSVAVILKGSPLVGQTVRFRPPSPKGVTVEKREPRGFRLRWQANREPEVAFYEILTSSSPNGPWRPRKKVRHPTREYVDKSVKPGTSAYYRIRAVSETDARSRNSKVVGGAR